MADSGTIEMQGRPAAETDNPSASRRLRDQTATLKDDVRELGRLTREASQEKIEQAKQATSEYLEIGRKKANEIEDSVIGYVREKPITSVLLAAGAGALLGFLFGRR